MPKATDLTFTNKLNAMWAGPVPRNEEVHPGRLKYEPSRFEQGFIIQHYAVEVGYRTDGWLAKNKDPLNDHLTRVLAQSSDRYVPLLFSDYVSASAVAIGKKRGLKKGAFRTVGQRHREQLASLMAQLQATQPHLVRCIVPNAHKKPGRVDVPLVLDQLRCNGVLEGIRIARLGYPNRLPFVEFRQRYEILTPGIIPRGYIDEREACRRMVNALDLDDAIFKIGTSKIFFKAGVLAELEERRDLLLFDMFSRLQAAARRYTARRQTKKILNRAVRPLLAATRNDEDVRRKEAELMLIKERAERDKQEREALQTLKMSLEAEKRRVEDALEAERALALDKDSLLECSKRREAELEEDVLALQSDLDTLDSQLDREMKLQKESEGKYEAMRETFDQAAEHLVRLESEQKEWAAREEELTTQLGAATERPGGGAPREATEELDAVHADMEELRRVSEELKNLAMQPDEDLDLLKDCLDVHLKELEGILTVEARNRELQKDNADGLEDEARQAKE
ncbi:P-loop containing nucleoside triphosphate hydrolase protein [Schizophyllum commune]